MGRNSGENDVMTPRGKFITLEGPEGSGKSTQAKRLAARLTERQHEVLCTREPGGTPTGELVREILQHDKAGDPVCPHAEALLFAASRAQLVQHVILPALAKGAWVVSDRFADSTTAYQGFGRGFNLETILAINAFAVDGAEPDLTLLLDVSVKAGFERLKARNQRSAGRHDRIEREELAFHERVRAGYMEIARLNPRIRIVDGGDDADLVEQRIWEIVQSAFGGQA